MLGQLVKPVIQSSQGRVEFLIKNHLDHTTKGGPDRQVGVIRTQPSRRSHFFVFGESREGPLE